MCMRPVASIIVPAFNAEASLSATLQSALTQTLRSIEVVLVDDGSSDMTQTIAMNAASADARMVVLVHPASLGPSAARNTAIAAARGDWVVLLDADDEMEPFRVEHLVAEAEARGLDVLADNLQLIDGASGQPMGCALDPLFMRQMHVLTLVDLLSADWPGRNRAYRGLGVAKPIIKRRLFIENAVRYDPNVRLGEDLLLYSTLILKGAKFGVTPAGNYLYSTNTPSISHRRVPTTELIEVNAKIRDLCTSRSLTSLPADLDLIDARGTALRLQVFTWSLKTRHFRLGAQMMHELGPLKLPKLLYGKLLERLKPRYTRRSKSLNCGSAEQPRTTSGAET